MASKAQNAGKSAPQLPNGIPSASHKFVTQGAFRERGDMNSGWCTQGAKAACLTATLLGLSLSACTYEDDADFDEDASTSSPDSGDPSSTPDGEGNTSTSTGSGAESSSTGATSLSTDSGADTSDTSNIGPKPGPIQIIGDSVLASDEDDEDGMGHWVAELTGVKVRNYAVSSAAVLFSEDDLPSIPSQYRPGNDAWVVIDGGANDFGAVCGTREGREIVDTIINASADEGVLVQLVDTILEDGAWVLLLGYYQVPDGTEFDECDQELAAHSRRLRALAESDARVAFADMGDAINFAKDPGDFEDDHIHPSASGNRKIAQLIADTIDMYEQ